MCGIVGYIGQNEAAPVLIKGLKKWEIEGINLLVSPDFAVAIKL